MLNADSYFLAQNAPDRFLISYFLVFFGQFAALSGEKNCIRIGGEKKKFL